VIKAIIFDFDGVIVDSVDLKTEAFKELYKDYNKQILKSIVAHHNQNGGMSRYEKFKFYHEKYLNKRITNLELNRLGKQFSRIVENKIIKTKYIKGSFEYISENYKKYKLFISSGTPENELRRICKKRNISKYFHKIYGSPNSKVKHIKNVIEYTKVLKKEIIYIGDSKNDYDAANKMNVNFIGLGKNFQKNGKNKIINIKNCFDLYKIIK
tara:strand:- start:7865 stop:8497 length:633 start_codon:yes stop_codon:yes gene_type:complete